jgi:hypothetical protein
LENSTFYRLIAAVGLLLVGAYLFAEALSNLILLPVALELASLSGAQAVAQVQTWQDAYVGQMMTGVICLAASALIAFFKVETFGLSSVSSGSQVSIARVAKISDMSTEQLAAELKTRMSRN